MNQKEWIETHGSPRLKRMVAENIPCHNTYLKERLSLEYPGWVWYKDCKGSIVDPNDVPDEAFEVLDKARKQIPEAKLKYFALSHTHTLGNYYIAMARFLGKKILFGVRRCDLKESGA